jgi:hypothetical protein
MESEDSKTESVSKTFSLTARPSIVQVNYFTLVWHFKSSYSGRRDAYVRTCNGTRTPSTEPRILAIFTHVFHQL